MCDPIGVIRSNGGTKLLPRRATTRRPFWLSIGLLITASLSYLFLLPIWQSQGDPNLEPSHLYGSRLIDILIFSWCFWIGSSIGSFLNVVAWRLPKGQSVNGRSHCPQCGVKIRGRDNIPFFGWLLLGGRCYSCHLPISIRYPLVELAVGVSLALVGFVEIFQLSLPRQLVRLAANPFSSILFDWNTVVTMLYHVGALSLSWACGLIRLDGHRLPKPLMLVVIFFSAAPVLIEPGLMVVPWQASQDASWTPEGQYLDAVMRVLTSFVAATLMARILVPAFCPNADLKLDPLGKSSARLIDLIVVLILPSVVIGWHSLAAIVLLSSVLAAVLQPKLDWRKEAFGCFSIAVPIAFTIQLIFWRTLHSPMTLGGAKYGTWLWPSEGGISWIILIWVGATLLIPLWLRDNDKIYSTAVSVEQDEDEDLEEQGCDANPLVTESFEDIRSDRLSPNDAGLTDDEPNNRSID